MTGSITREDPRSPDIVALLERHLAQMHATTPAEFVFALDVGALCHPSISFFASRDGGALLGVGALKQLDAGHGEVKSMHTAAEARGRGVGAALVEHLLAEARSLGLRRVSLETGSGPAFEPARRLYARAGFTPCGPFGDYPDADTSAFMTIELH